MPPTRFFSCEALKRSLLFYIKLKQAGFLSEGVYKGAKKRKRKERRKERRKKEMFLSTSQGNSGPHRINGDKLFNNPVH